MREPHCLGERKGKKKLLEMRESDGKENNQQLGVGARNLLWCNKKILLFLF